MNLPIPKTTIVKTAKEFNQSLKDLDIQVLGGDTETTGLDPTMGARVRLVSLSSYDHCYVYDVWKFTDSQRKRFIQFITEPTRRLVFHNAKFDIKLLKYTFNIPRFNKIFCTMIGSQILSFGRSSYGHSLKDVVFNVLGVTLDKELQTSDWSAKVLSDEQLEYAAKDSWYLLYLRDYMIEQFKSNRLVEVAQIEMEAIEPTIAMELNGFNFDIDGWMRTYERNKLRVLRMQLKVSKYLSPQNVLFEGITGFKVSSDKQLKEQMKANGIKLPTKWDKKKGCEKETIEIDYLEKIKDSHPVIPLMIKCSRLEKSTTSYGANWKERINPFTNRIHTSYKQLVTLTGRYSCDLHQIPRESLYRKRFISSPGKVLVWADYSQMELRILCEHSQDRNMLKAFVEDKDIHTHTASLIFKVAYEKVDKKIQRMRAKNLNFGIVFGIGAERFARNAEMTEKEAEKLIKDYFAAYPDLDQWLTWARKQARYMRKSSTMSGRLIRYKFDPQVKWQVSEAERNGMNTPIQGTCADILKLALRMVYDELDGKADLLHCVHDEIITECLPEDVDLVKAKLVECMEIAAKRYIEVTPIKVDCSVGTHWSK